MAAHTMADLRAYVTGPGNCGLAKVASTVVLNVEHASLRARFPELRLDLHTTVGDLKVKLATHVGTAVADMGLTLCNGSGAPLAALTDDARPLGYYSPPDGGTLRVTDANPHSLAASGWLEDVSKVEKYVMPDAEYDAREGTYRAYAKARRAVDPSWTAARELAARRGEAVPPAPAAVGDGFQAAEAAGIAVGCRCEVAPGGRRGVVRHVGPVPGLPAGHWVGVEFDEPVGRHDGTPVAGGARLFACAPRHGGCVRPAAVVTGDFPPADDGLLGSDDEV